MIYLDNCATTEMRQEVIEDMVHSMKEDYGNPSSLHSLGLAAEKKVEGARGIIADFLRVDPREVYFTSGGTESNNLAINMAVKRLRRRGRHIISSTIEHPSVLNLMKDLEERGYEISYVRPNDQGQIEASEVIKLLREDTILVSLMQVNNELGTISDLEGIGAYIESQGLATLFHVDGVQGYGKVPIDLKGLSIDFYSFSSHKIHGPKGIGGLFIDGRNKLSKVVFGGNQESGLRSGTENVPAIVGFGRASQIQARKFQEEGEYVGGLRDYFESRLSDSLEGLRINSRGASRSPYVSNVSLRGTRGEILLHYLEGDGIYISTSSACSSNDTKKSHVLVSLGLSKEEIEGTIRVCFSHRNTREEVDLVVEKIIEYTGEIRKIIKG